MRFEVWHLFVISVLYLGLLFVIASAAERKWLPEKLIAHPLVYTLSIGVYATSWSYYGSVGLADREGYTFLAVYIGVTLAFLLSPLLLRPILRLITDYQLSSLADLLAFRYNSQLAGILVTLFMLTGALPYMALQIQAVTDSLQVLTGEAQSWLLSLGFCLTISLFAILFGARHVTPREKHEGLVVAIAFESLVKLVAILVVGFYAVFGIFNGLDGFNSWIEHNPEVVTSLMQPIHDGPWAMMLLLSFAAAFLLPRQFHMIFVENIRPSNLSFASWAFPLFLLLLNLFIPVILWVGQSIDLSYGPDMYVLGVAMQSQNPAMPLFIFVGGISAASAMIIVTTIALASMCLNHLLLPVSFLRQTQQSDIYRFLIWSKRAFAVLIVLAGYLFYMVLQTHRELTDLGLIAFVAVAQFLPGVFGVLFWRHASRPGFISGLSVGAVLWVLTLILPLFAKTGWLAGTWLEDIMIPMTSTTSAFWTLLVNTSLFVIVSLIRPPSEQEARAAQACASGGEVRSFAIPYAVSVEQFEIRLTELIGERMAEREIRVALQDLALERNNLDRIDLGRLRNQIRRNLSGLVGPLLANMVVNEQLEIDTSARVAIADTLEFVEKSLSDSRTELKEVAGELDSLRRFHRQVLHDLPLAVVTISPELQVVSWNRAMENLSTLQEKDVIGLRLQGLDRPWSELLLDFIRGGEQVRRSLRINKDERQYILNLFKSDVTSKLDDLHHGYVVLIEDHSEIHQLESELAHSERLASIGRLATGVAHEIGNPVTGIACLAQDVKAMPDDRDLQASSADNILELTERISRIVNSLVSYSHAGAINDYRPEKVPLTQVIKDSINLVKLGKKSKNIGFELDSENTLEVMGDYQKLQQVMVILLTNAIDASEDGATVFIRGQSSDGRVKVSVRDSGHGIDEKNLEKVFDPFFTTKQAGEGTGLGLSLAYNIIQEHGGQIEVHSQSGQGAEFIVRLGGASESSEQQVGYA